LRTSFVDESAGDRAKLLKVGGKVVDVAGERRVLFQQSLRRNVVLALGPI
jgi:hypothetical protein